MAAKSEAGLLLKSPIKHAYERYDEAGNRKMGTRRC